MAEKDRNEISADEKRIADMKQAYDTYPVSEEALNRVRAGIEQAKQEKKGIKKNKIVRFGKTAGISAAAAMAAITLLANSGEHIAKAMEQIPIIGAIARVVTFRNYSDINGNFEAYVDIPQIAEENTDNQPALEAINKSIEEYAQELIDMYEQNLQTFNGEGHYALHSSYEVIRNDERYLSIRINSVVVMAGGNQFVKIFNVDKSTGKIMTLADLFEEDDDYVTIISDNIKTQMKEQMEKDESLVYFIYSEEEPFGFDTITEDTNFYLNENNEPVIVFNEYEVAPGYMGVAEFTIPADVISVK